jgi:predicted  nucleic acid-binding Zn-ribbon protein
MSKIINSVIIGLFGAGCFSVGIYYSTWEFEEQVNVWDSNYQIITDKVYAFEKISDPKTIRLYVKELNKILDDVTFLGKIVESGQVSSESLSEFFSSYDKKINSVNNRILELNKEHMESVSKYDLQIAGLSEDEDDLFNITEDLQKKIQEQNDYINKLNVEIGQSVKQLEDNIQTIKSSKYGNKIWTVKK